MCCVSYLKDTVSSLVSFFYLPPPSLFIFLTLSTAIFHFSSLMTQLDDGQGTVLMTTVAMPVFSTKNETVSAHQMLCKQ